MNVRAVVPLSFAFVCSSGCAPSESRPRVVDHTERVAPPHHDVERMIDPGEREDAEPPRDAAVDEAPKTAGFFCSLSKDRRCVDFCLRSAAACDEARRRDGESCRAAFKTDCAPSPTAWCISWVDPETPERQTVCKALRSTCEDFRAEAARRNVHFKRAPTKDASACELTR